MPYQGSWLLLAGPSGPSHETASIKALEMGRNVTVVH